MVLLTPKVCKQKERFKIIQNNHKTNLTSFEVQSPGSVFFLPKTGPSPLQVQRIDRILEFAGYPTLKRLQDIRMKKTNLLILHDIRRYTIIDLLSCCGLIFRSNIR